MELSIFYSHKILLLIQCKVWTVARLLGIGSGTLTGYHRWKVAFVLKIKSRLVMPERIF